MTILLIRVGELRNKNNMPNILLTGATGLLGRNLKIEADRPTHQELDITHFIYGQPYELIVHAAAYTKVQHADQEKTKCFDVNVNGTLNLLETYSETPFVYISSEYARNPVNFYSLTKSIAEQLVVSRRAPYLIIRTLFKPYPYPFTHAFIDQFTQGDTVDIIAPLIDKEIQDWDRETSKLMYVGTGRKTMYQLAQKSRPDVLPNSIREMKISIPKDYK